MFDWGFILDIMPEMMNALWITLQATVIGMTLALILGLIWTLTRRSSNRLFARPIGWFVEFIRSTPLLVQIYFLFYVFPTFGITLSPMLTGILALGLHYSAYVSEVYRAGIEGISRGQWEAAKALNLSQTHTFRFIILPQAIPPVVPALGNYLVAMFKDTPMLSAITVLELLQTAKMIGSDTFRYLEPLTLVGVIFLILSLATAVLIRRVEAWLVIRSF